MSQPPYVAILFAINLLTMLFDQVSAQQVQGVSRIDPSLGSDSAGGWLPVYSASSVSGDGRYVCFSSSGGNLVPGEVKANTASDVFLFNRASGTTVLVRHAAGSSVTTGNDV